MAGKDDTKTNTTQTNNITAANVSITGNFDSKKGDEDKEEADNDDTTTKHTIRIPVKFGSPRTNNFNSIVITSRFAATRQRLASLRYVMCIS